MGCFFKKTFEAAWIPTEPWFVCKIVVGGIAFFLMGSFLETYVLK